MYKGQTKKEIKIKIKMEIKIKMKIEINKMMWHYINIY